MARTNTGSTSNYITATPPTLSGSVTLACWFRPANLTATSNLLTLTHGDGTYVALAFDGSNAYSLGDNRVIVDAGGSVAVSATPAVQETSLWHHACCRHTNTSLRDVLIDGGGVGTNTSSQSFTTPAYFNIGAYYAGGSVFSPLNGAIAEVGIWDVVLTDDEVRRLATQGTKPTDVRPDHLVIYRSLDANESLPRGGKGLTGLAMTGTMGVAEQPFRARPRRRFRFKAPSGAAYTLTAASGSYSLTGQTAGVRASRKLTAAHGSYALTGQAAALKVGYKVAAGQGSYALTGQAATLRATRMMAAAQGSYSLTGQAAALKFGHVLIAAQGSYALTGQAAVLRRGYTAVAGQGAYSLTGQAAGLRASRLLAGAQGSYSLTGQSATLTYFAPGSYSLTAAQGSYALTGQAVALRASRILTAAQGAYSITGQAATLTYGSITIASICMSFYHQSGSGVVQTGGSSVESDTSLSVSSGFPSTGDYPVIGSGTLVTGTFSGTAQLRLRAEVAGVVTARAGMTLIVEKVA